VEENNIILVEKLTKTYVMGAQTLHALREISFNIKKNEYVALMGPSGSGKSTIMNRFTDLWLLLFKPNECQSDERC